MVYVRVKRKGDATPILKKIADALRGPKNVKVGFPAGEAGGEVLDKAFYNEFGTEDIPERPFLRGGIKGAKGQFKTQVQSDAKAILNGKRTMRQSLERLGLKGQQVIQKEITALDSPPNAESTIRQKGSSNPLIDTGEMRGAVTWKVDE